MKSTTQVTLIAAAAIIVDLGRLNEENYMEKERETKLSTVAFSTGSQ
jgi:hypothetical protein